MEVEFNKLLKKNIFDDNVLLKLAPDYSPENFMLRMQLRRTMVRDTHASQSHRTGKNSVANTLQKKNLKRAKELPKINKEILKLQNSFNNTNLKNKIMLKEAVKYIENAKTQDLDAIDSKEYESLRIETEPHIEKITEVKTNLFISNDNDFKMMPKMNAIKNNKETKVTIKPKQTVKKMDHTHYPKDEVLSVKCTFLNKSEEKAVHENEEISLEADKDIIIIDQASETTMLENGSNKEVDDLQTLLIMMAISPNVNVVESEYFENDMANSRINPIPKKMTGISLQKQDKINCSKVLQTQTENFIELLNVTPIKVFVSCRERYILKKYINKWRKYVTNRKIIESQRVQETLNNFFDKVAMKKKLSNSSMHSTNKSNMTAREFSSYLQRYKMQKHVIAIQKAKLEEQNRIIEEFKYNKIVAATHQSVDVLKEEVRKTYFEFDRHLKPKLKCMTNELKLHDIEEPALVLHCLKVPQFLQRMEKRAREREEKHAMIRERRRQMEEDRQKLKQQAELAKAEMDKEEKINRIKELKDKRKREKIEGIRKKQFAERIRALTVMAELHYEKNLMAEYGIRPLRKLMEIKRDDMEKAKAQFNFQLKKNLFLRWMWHTEDMWIERNFKAEDLYRKKKLLITFNAFKQNHLEYVSKKQVAEDYYDLYVIQFAFRKFREGIEVSRKEHEIKWQKAVVYCNCNLLFKTFTCWRTLPALTTLKRVQEARKARWREKVLQVVPDYSPPDD